MKIVTNPNPTAAEKELYQYAGIYRIEEDSDRLVYAFVPGNGGRPNMPGVIEIDENDLRGRIVLHKLGEIVVFEGRVSGDAKILSLLLQRAVELGWK